jgi:hypothetical protein
VRAVELYNLADDLGEEKNLAEAHPELVAKAVEMMKAARTPDPSWPDPAAGSAKGSGRRRRK